MGHDVHIAYIKEGTYKPELSGVVLHRLTTRYNYDPYLLWQLFRIARLIKPNIINTWILQMDILGGIGAKLNKIPWIFREPSSTVGYSPTWKNRLRVRVGSFANAIVSNSRGGDEYWKTKLPYSRRYIVSNGLPMDEIDNTVAVLPLGLSKLDAPMVLCVGRMIASKNLRLFLEALACVKQGHNVSGIFCGEGPQRSELEGLRHKLGLDGDVHFLGHLPIASVWAILKKATVFVSLSAYEGCPNTVMEAMACGCPLVLSDIPAHREIVDGRCALFVDPSNSQQVADNIIDTLSNAGASRGRALIAKQKTRDWSTVAMARNYERVYKDILCL